MKPLTNNWRGTTEHHCYAEIVTDSTAGTRNIKTHNRKTQESKKISIMLKATGTDKPFS
jgi:hypothetical protein